MTDHQAAFPTTHLLRRPVRKAGQFTLFGASILCRDPLVGGAMPFVLFKVTWPIPGC